MEPLVREFTEELAGFAVRNGFSRQRRDFWVLPKGDNFVSAVSLGHSGKRGVESFSFHAHVYFEAFDRLCAIAFARKYSRYRVPSAARYISGVCEVQLQDSNSYANALKELSEKLIENARPAALDIGKPEHVLDTIYNTGELPERLAAYHYWQSGVMDARQLREIVGKSPYEDFDMRVQHFFKAIRN